MDTNNNSSEQNDVDHHPEADEIEQEPQESTVKQDPPNSREQQRRPDPERIEFHVKYDASDMPGLESGTQTPIEDEHQGGSEEDEDDDGDVSRDSSTNNRVSKMTSNNDNNQASGKASTNKAVGVITVLESEVDGAESIELELEDDNSLLLTSLTSLFPDATGLKYRHSETNTLRGVKLADGKFIEPLDGWSSVKNYICVCNRGSKRKIEDGDESGGRKVARTDNEKPMGDGGSDLVVLGLPWTTTEDTMKSYFEQYGEVVMVQVKTDPKSGKSRGFGFVRFAKSSIQNKLLSMRHFIDGRYCDVRVPLSKAEAEQTKAAQLSRKIFVGRLPDNITTDDLRNHFSEYGTLTDVFIPKPFRNFAFVTFGTSDMAQSIFKHKHVIKGAPVQISEAIPRDNPPNNYGGGGGGGGSGGGGAFSGAGPQNSVNAYGSGYGGGTANNNIHPFNSNYGTHQASHHFHNKNSAGTAQYGAGVYSNSRKMHPQSTYYQMPSYGTSGPGGTLDPASYANHGDYSGFAGAASGYGQAAAASVNGGQYYKVQQQQPPPVMTPNQNHSTYPNQSSYSSHGANFSRGSYGSVWK